MSGSVVYRDLIIYRHYYYFFCFVCRATKTPLHNRLYTRHNFTLHPLHSVCLSLPLPSSAGLAHLLFHFPSCLSFKCISLLFSFVLLHAVLFSECVSLHLIYSLARRCIFLTYFFFTFAFHPHVFSLTHVNYHVYVFDLITSVYSPVFLNCYIYTHFTCYSPLALPPSDVIYK